MDLDGLDALLAKLDSMDANIEDDVDEVVKSNTFDMTEETVENERARMIKRDPRTGKRYWTGNTARNTLPHQNEKMNWKTLVNVDYAGKRIPSLLAIAG